LKLNDNSKRRIKIKMNLLPGNYPQFFQTKSFFKREGINIIRNEELDAHNASSIN
jgi:hypothetical protein